MSSAKRILEETRRGVASEILSQKIPWEKLTETDLIELIKYTRDQPDVTESYRLLDYLFRVSREKDLWFSVEVLSNAVQYQKMSLEDRRSILLSMRKRLDQIKDKIAVEQPTEANLRQYMIFEAAYHAVNGTMLNETGKLNDAVQNYQVARGIYEQLGLFQQAEKYTGIIHKINSKKPTHSLRTTGNLIPPPIQSLSVDSKIAVHLPVQGNPPLPQPQLATNQQVQDQPFSFKRNTGSFVLDEKAKSPEAIAIQLPPPTQVPMESIDPTPGFGKVGDQESKTDPTLLTDDGLQRLTDHIQQLTQILAETQMQIQEFLSRRSILVSEVQNLERKIGELNKKLEQLEKKE